MDFNREFRLNSSQIQHLFVMRAVAERLQDNLQREKDKEITS